MKHKTIWIAVALLVGLGVFIYYIQGQRKQISEFNEIVSQLINEGEYHEAADALLLLRQKQLSKPLAARVEEHLAICYQRIGDDPGLSIPNRARWYRKSLQHHPDILTREQRQEMELGERMQQQR